MIHKVIISSLDSETGAKDNGQLVTGRHEKLSKYFSFITINHLENLSELNSDALS